MTLSNTIIMRCEESHSEQRAPLTPEDAGQLIQAGYDIFVESSPQRIFADQAYQERGCQLLPKGSWQTSSRNTTVLGIKALPTVKTPFNQTHIYFAHAYRGQPHSAALLQKFKEDRGVILDLEYLVDPEGRRLVSFSKYAGIAGAIVGLNTLLPEPYPLQTGLGSLEWYRRIQGESTLDNHRYLITGAEGRCGEGVRSVLQALGLPFEWWTLKDTLSNRPLREILNFDVLFHCAAAFQVQQPMLTLSHLEKGRGPSWVVDITCDMNNPYNLLHLGHRSTSFAEPIQWIERQGKSLGVIAIDHLPSLLPQESSEWFSSQLTPLLLNPQHSAWQASFHHYQQAISQLGGAR